MSNDDTLQVQLPPQTDGDQWDVIAVDHVKKLVDESGSPIERDHTIVMLRNRRNGELKQWTTPGKFTIEQLQAEGAQ